MLYRAELERALAYNRNCMISWARVGISCRVEIQRLTRIAAELLDAHPNLWIDITWLVFDYYVLGRLPTGYPSGDTLEDWVDLIEAHPDRFTVGTDKVGHWKIYSAEVMTWLSYVHCAFT